MSMYVLVNSQTETINSVSHCVRLCSKHFTISTLYRVSEEVGIMAMLKGDVVFNSLVDAKLDAEVKFPNCQVEHVYHWRISTNDNAHRELSHWRDVYSKMFFSSIKRAPKSPHDNTRV